MKKLKFQYIILIVLLFGLYQSGAQIDTNITFLHNKLDDVLNNKIKYSDISKDINLRSLMIQSCDSSLSKKIYKTFSYIEKNGSIKDRAEIRCIFQRFLIINNNEREAIEFSKNAIEFCESNNAFLYIPTLLYRIRVIARKSIYMKDFLGYILDKIKLYESINQKSSLSICYFILNAYYYRFGNIEQSINALTKAIENLDINDKTEYYGEIGHLLGKRGITNNTSVIGVFYGDWGNNEKSKEYLNKSLKIIGKDSLDPAYPFTLIELGRLALKEGKLDSAYNFFNIEFISSLNFEPFFNRIYLCYKADRFIGLSKVFLEMKNFNKSYEFIQYAENLKMKNKLKIISDGSYNLNINTYYGDFYFKKGEYENSLKYYLKDLRDIKDIFSFELFAASYMNIAKVYKKMNNHKKAIEYLEKYYSMKDTLEANENLNKIARMEMDLQIKENENQIITLKTNESRNKNIIFGVSFGLILFLIIILFTVSRLNLKRKANSELEKKNEIIEGNNYKLQILNEDLAIKHLQISAEREKSENLLLNILPTPIAGRLKEGETKIADYFEEASVVFIDIVDFTIKSANADPKRIVEVLNRIYTEFDKIAKKHGLEKIKTIGDCYMAASGVPLPMKDNAIAAALFSLEVMTNINGYITEDGTVINFRCGIDCGPVVAGVIGENKFIYDIWGDTVNTAARMEEYSEPGKIQISERFKSKLEQIPHIFALSMGESVEGGLIPISKSEISGLPSIEKGEHGRFLFIGRGEIEVKGKGLMRTWFLEGK